MSPITIDVAFDNEAKVWVAHSDDIPLVTEAGSFEALYAKLPDLITDVLAANGDIRSGQDLPFELITRSRTARVLKQAGLPKAF